MLMQNLRKVAGLKALQVGMCSRAGGDSSVWFDVKKPYKLHLLEKGPDQKVRTSRQQVVGLYRDMLTIRYLASASRVMTSEGLVRGRAHSCIGQEATYPGMEAALTKTDTVITSYRAHGWAYVRGISTDGILGEMAGKKTGCCQGKAGSMHPFLPGRFYGGQAIVAAQVPLGVGLALSHKYQGTDNLSVAVCGDQGANQGQVFESFNMAKLWRLPVIFLIENNGAGIGTTLDMCTVNQEFYRRGDFIPGLWVDGVDALAVLEASRFAVDHVRSGKGPFVLEVETTKYDLHWVDPYETGSSAEVKYEEHTGPRDPIPELEDRLLEAKIFTKDEIEVTHQEIKQAMSESVRRTLEAHELPISAMYESVYSDLPRNFVIRGQHSNANVKVNASVKS